MIHQLNRHVRSLGVARNLTDDIGRLVFSVLHMVAKCEFRYPRLRVREGLAAARTTGKIRDRQRNLSPHPEAHLAALHITGPDIHSDFARLLGVGRSTVYGAPTRAASAYRKHMNARVA